MSKSQDQMLKDMQLRGLSPQTQSNYLRHLRQFEEFSQSPAEDLGTEEIRNFLHFLITEKNLSGGYVNNVHNALKFFFETTLDRTWNYRQIPRIKRTGKLPVFLSREEIKRLFAVTSKLNFRAMFMVAYASGLRVSEIAHLNVSDIDSENMQIFVREGKGKIDRYSLLSQVGLDILRLYWKQYRPTLWLFPGVISGRPITIHTIENAFRKARDKAGINKKASIHSLRHSFATHLLENGTDIVRIQKLLGHARITSTMLYLHLAKVKILQVKSPLDSLWEDDQLES